MQRLTREHETAVGAHRRPHLKAFPVRLDAALDVAEIVLEGADGHGELVTEVVEKPLFFVEALNDLLTTGSGRAHGSLVVIVAGGCSGPPSVSHSRTGTPSTQRSSMTPVPFRTRIVTHAGR